MCPSDKQQPNGSSPRRSTHAKIQLPFDINNSPLVSHEIRQQVATEAAQTGHWIRLIEHVVETVAATVDQQQGDGDDGYIIKSSIQSVPPTLPTSCHLIIQEAAAVGSMKHGRNTIIITTENPNSNATIDDDDAIISSFQRQLWQNGESTSTSNAPKRIIQATDEDDAAHLVNQYVEYRQQVRSQQAVDFIAKAEESERYHQQQELYQSQQLVLPTAVVPRFKRQRPSYKIFSQIKAELVEAVVTQALDRQTRLVVDKQFLVRTACHCVYCSSGYPNPFQTQAYAKLRSRQGWSDDSMCDEEQEQETVTVASKDPTHSQQPMAATSSTTTTRSKTATTLDAALANSVHTPVNDPHLPSHFRTTTTPKHHQRAWKERVLHHQIPNSTQQGSGNNINVVATSPRRISTPNSVWGSPQQKPRTDRKTLDVPLSFTVSERKTAFTRSLSYSSLPQEWLQGKNTQQRARESLNVVPSSPRLISSPTPVWASPQPKPRTGRKTLDAPLSCSAAESKTIRKERMIDFQALDNIPQRSRESLDDMATSPRRISTPTPVWASPQQKTRTDRKALDAPLSCSAAESKTIRKERSIDFQVLDNVPQRSRESINNVLTSPTPVWGSPQPKPRTGRKTLDAPLSSSVADRKTAFTRSLSYSSLPQEWFQGKNTQQRSRERLNVVPTSPRQISSPTPLWASPQPRPSTGRKTLDAPLSCSAAESKTIRKERMIDFQVLDSVPQRSRESMNNAVTSPRLLSSPTPVWAPPQPKPWTSRKTVDAPLSCSVADRKTAFTRSSSYSSLPQEWLQGKSTQQRSRQSINNVLASPRRISTPTPVWASPQQKTRTGRKALDAPLSCSATESKTAFTRSSSYSSLPQEWLQVKQRLTSPAVRSKSVAPAAGLPPPPPLSSPPLPPPPLTILEQQHPKIHPISV